MQAQQRMLLAGRHATRTLWQRCQRTPRAVREVLTGIWLLNNLLGA
jgi:hypothetical protein